MIKTSPLQTRSVEATQPVSTRDELVQALTRCDRQADQTVSRTRRIVHGTVIGMEEQRRSRRRKSGLVLLASVVCITLLAPALWSSWDSFAVGGHFGDPQTQAYLLGVMLIPGIIAAAIAGFMRSRYRGGQYL